MLLKRNLLETVTIISCSGTLICILLHYLTNISPISGIWFPIYILFLFFVSVTFSFKFIQWLLDLNKPLKYDVDGLVTNYPYLSFLRSILPRLPKKVVRECKEYDTNDLSVISTVLERRLVSAWYVPYVSQEIGFPFACKQMLDQMIGKAFQICNKIEPKDVYIDICSILTVHLNEYKKAIKRHEKCPTNSIESLYKKSHPIFNSDMKNPTAEQCTNLLRIILKELVPWELWDTPHSELLVRILSKKLDNFIDSTLADPVWLNDKLMTILKGKTTEIINDQSEPTPFFEGEIKFENIDLYQEIPKEEPKGEFSSPEAVEKPETPTIESALSTLVAKTTAPILQRAINEDLESSTETCEAMEDSNLSEPIEIQSSPVLRQRRGRQGRNEVKIYDRIIEGSVKTWDTDSDLQCISLGQDLLASLNGEITLSRLWGQDPQDVDTGGKEAKLWFGEEDTMDMELPSTELSPVKKEQSPKPTDALLKDIQTTVHQAKTKIGDLQVPNPIDVPDNDEAAGMMEGLLDFGIAGFKKGLRLTGLGDDSQDKSPSHREKEKSLEKSPPPDSKNKPAEQKEVIMSSIIQREDNGVNGTSAPPLVKQQRVSSQDSMQASLSRPIKSEFPTLVPLGDSPEPEYEEAADLSTSIAKLRCLLQQRAQANNQPEEIWWEGAEETRGRIQHHHSSRPVDTATLADEYDMNADRNTSPGQTSNNMQRLDRLFQRTVTGVFNSIKTAVGAEGEAEGAAGGAGAGGAPHHWAYVCTSVELSVGGAVARLVGSRRAYTHVDAALDSLDQLTTPPGKKELIPEDFDEWTSALSAGWGASAGVCGAGGVYAAHVTNRLATLLLADLAEACIDVYLDEISVWLRKRVFEVFEELSDRVDTSEDRSKTSPLRKLDLDETCNAIIEKLPVLQIFGAETVHAAVKLSVSSLSHKDINRHVVFRALDMMALHFKQAAGLRHPSFDNN